MEWLLLTIFISAEPNTPPGNSINEFNSYKECEEALIKRNNIDEAISFFEYREVIGEITIVVKGIKSKKSSDNINKIEIKKELYELTKAGLSLSEASKYLAKRNNVKKSIIYNMNKL